MGLDFTVIAHTWDYLLWGRSASGEIGGLLLTVLMAMSSGLLALIAGILLALAAWYWKGAVRKFLFISADFIRGIPLIFVIFWIYFLVPALFGGSVPNSVSVVVALAWFSSAAVMHSTLAGLEALPRGQREAGTAAGLSDGQVIRYILLPQALRNLVPSYIGLFVSLIKDTSLAFIVNIPELTMVANQVNSRTQVFPTEIFLFTGFLYFVLCTGLEGLLRLWAHKTSPGNRRRKLAV